MVWRILHEQGLYPYHVQRVQSEDLPRGVNFCEEFLRQHNEDIGFVKTLITTDEAWFMREGVHNSRNTHIWSDENQHAIHEHRLQEQF
jgi:hypothetical protein